MIKKLLLPLILLLCCGIGAKASHFMGTEIGYEYTGTGNVYRVIVTQYVECQTTGVAIFLAPTVNFQSAGTGQSFSRTILSGTSDTLKELYCPSISPACGGSYQIFITQRWADTVTLNPASDWTMSYLDGSRSSSVTNLQNPSNLSLYVSAFLNNLTAPNSCALMVGVPQIVASVNNIVLQPFQVIDGNGDSIVVSMMQPQTSTGGPSYPAPYASGYSVTQPMGPGSFAQLNIANSVLKTYGTNIGRFALAARAYDYRNGQLVGYSSRDWALIMTNITNPKAPTPVAGTSFVRTTCPGQPASYTFNFIDSVATDSVFLQFTPPANGLSYTTSYTNGVGAASATISFTPPANWNVAANPYFLIKLTARDHACPFSGYATYNVVVHSIQCGSDTVWAGDADANYTVNMYDPLAVALAYGATGPARSGASIAWAGQWCANWAGSLSGTGVNYKHADCDGNGTVNSSDLAAITANYSLTHPREGYAAVAKGAGIPDLYFDHSGVNPAPGITISIPIKFGSTALPVSNMYGLAARIRINGITPNNLAVTYPASWLGTGANTLRFTKCTTANTIDWAYARTDHQNASGNSTIGALGFTIPATAVAGDRIVLTLENVKVINAAGTEMTSYNVLSDTFLVKALGVGGVQSGISNAMVVPNPSQRNAVLALSLSQSTLLTVNVTDITGRLVWKSGPATFTAGQHEVSLPRQLRSGVYFVRINTDAGGETLKWIEE